MDMLLASGSNAVPDLTFDEWQELMENTDFAILDTLMPHIQNLEVLLTDIRGYIALIIISVCVIAAIWFIWTLLKQFFIW